MGTVLIVGCSLDPWQPPPSPADASPLPPMHDVFDVCACTARPYALVVSDDDDAVVADAQWNHCPLRPYVAGSKGLCLSLIALRLGVELLLMGGVALLMGWAVLPTVLSPLTEPTPAASTSSLISELSHSQQRLAEHRRLLPAWSQLIRSPDDEAELRAQHLLHAGLPLCGQLRGDAAEGQGNWSLTPTNDFRYHPPGCRLRRPTGQQAQQCLASQSLLFLGDSLARYQYISLLHFLFLGHWPEPLGGLPHHPSLLIEKEWGGWPDFYSNASAAFPPGLLTCAGCLHVPRTGGWDYDIRERWHGYLASHHLTLRFTFYVLAPSLLTGLQELADECAFTPSTLTPSRPHYSYDADHRQPQPCPDNATRVDCRYRPDAPFHRPTALVANTGIWGEGAPRHWAAVRDGLSANLPLRAVWRTTTPAAGGVENEGARREEELGVFDGGGGALEGEGEGGERGGGGGGGRRWEVWDVFDMARKGVASRAYTDQFHFHPFVYEEMNVWLLNRLCDEQWRWSQPAPRSVDR